MSKFFQDSFGHIQPDSVRDLNQQIQTDEIKVPMRDKRTGAEYLVTERRPNGPQGDFRVPRQQVEERFKTIMGLDRTINPRPFGHESREAADASVDLDRRPEPMVSESEIENMVRQREQFNAKRQSYAPTREPVTQDTWTDHGQYTEDPSGRIRDKPANTIGPFGTELLRPRHMQTSEEKLVDRSALEVHRPQHQYSTQTRSQDPLEQRINKDSKLQSLITNAFRGLRALHNKESEQSVNDRAPQKETLLVAHSILDMGLMSKWEPPNVATDRPHKPDDVAHAVGVRALQSLMKGPLAPDIQDLPKAEREAVSLALGRTILNALTVRPASKGLAPDASDRPEVQELIQSISNAVSPQILAGIVNQQALSDRKPKDLQDLKRLAQPANKAMGVPNRHTVTVNQRPEFIAQQKQANTFTAGLQVPKESKKNLFFNDYDGHSRQELAPEMPESRKSVHAHQQMHTHGTFSRRTE